MAYKVALAGRQRMLLVGMFLGDRSAIGQTA
jgi:hypothetical protein